MKSVTLGLVGAIVAFGTIGLVSSCSNMAGDCDRVARCRPPDMGGSSSGVGGGASATSSAASSSSMAGTSEVCCAFVGNGGTAGVAGTAGAASVGISAVDGAHIASCVTGTTSDQQCAPCQSDASCPDTAPACDLALQACVRCTADSHCSGATPGCNTATKTCVACTKEVHCSGATPVCDTSSNQCVACSSNTHCTNVPNTVCDASTSICVECLASADCKDPSKKVCNTSAKRCAQCLAKADCAGVPGKPTCDTTPGSATASTCVACLENTDCEGTPAPPFCRKDTKQCVACLANTDCTNPSTSRCDPTSNTCAPCATDKDCAQIAGKSLCNAGACVQCTVANESACNGNSCNPKLNACTATAKGSVNLCGACVADSECTNGLGTITARCVPMTFGPAAAPHGTYCLETVASGCDQPYDSTSVMKITAASASSAPSADYCGINQELVTCEAVRDMEDASNTIRCTNSATSQPDDALCGCPRDVDGKCTGPGQGGLCRAVGSQNRCTIHCGGGSNCRADYTCIVASPKYCG